MAEITRRRTGELLRKLFEILMAEPDGMKAKDALAKLASTVQLSPYEAGDYPNGGGRRFDKIVRFATVDTTKAGWLVKAKGLWTITDAGRKAHKKFQDPEAFYKEAVRLYRAWKSSQPRDDEEAPGDADDTAGNVVVRDATLTFEMADEQAWSEVERFLTQMQPYDFQHLVAALLKGMSYHVAWVAPPGRDGGIDILAFSDPLGTRPPRIKVQVKRQQSTVSVDGLRSFLAVLGDDDVGIFVNTGGFTKDAMEEARTQASRRVTLVDLERLFELWVEHYKKLDDEARRRMPLKPIYFLAPQE
jgi:restriction system protein